jgi:hypothetical protein
MSVFGTILEKLGLHKHAEPTQATGAPGSAAQPGSSTSASPQRPSAAATGSTQQQAGTAGAPAAQRQAGPTAATASPSRPVAPPPPVMSDVDVTARLEKLAAGNPQKLNWRASIVDLMKLLGMESSLAERKELATELGYPADQMSDTAKMNTWLHRQVLLKIAENGGNVPKELLN